MINDYTIMEAVKRVSKWIYNFETFYKNNQRYNINHAVGYFVDVMANGEIDNAGVLVECGFDTLCIDDCTRTARNKCTRLVVDLNTTNDQIECNLRLEIKKLIIENKKKKMFEDFI